MIKAVIFDCFGVLTTDLWKAFLATIADGPDKEEARKLNKAYDAGVISMEEFVGGVQKVTGQRPNRVEELEHRKGEITKDTQVLGYIRELKNQGYKIGLLSNVGTNWIREVLLTEEEQQLFGAMVFSFEAGMVKPDPRIYQLVCGNLGVDLNEAVFIDDSDYYVVAAQDQGMQGIVYQDFSQMQKELLLLLAKK